MIVPPDFHYMACPEKRSRDLETRSLFFHPWNKLYIDDTLANYLNFSLTSPLAIWDHEYIPK